MCVREREIERGGEREREREQQQQQNSTCVRDVDWSLLKSPWRQFSFFFQFHAEFIRRHLGLPDKLLEVWKIDLLKKERKKKHTFYNNLLVNISSSKQQDTSHSFPFTELVSERIISTPLAQVQAKNFKSGSLLRWAAQCCTSTNSIQGLFCTYLCFISRSVLYVDLKLFFSRRSGDTA